MSISRKEPSKVTTKQIIKQPEPKFVIIGKQEKDYDRDEVATWLKQHNKQLEEFWEEWLELEKAICYDNSLDCLEEFRGFRLKWKEVLKV